MFVARQIGVAVLFALFGGLDWIVMSWIGLVLQAALGLASMAFLVGGALQMLPDWLGFQVIGVMVLFASLYSWRHSFTNEKHYSPYQRWGHGILGVGIAGFVALKWGQLVFTVFPK